MHVPNIFLFGALYTFKKLIIISDWYLKNSSVIQKIRHRPLSYFVECNEGPDAGSFELN